MKLLFAMVSKGRCPWADEAAADYLKRIRRFHPSEELRLRPARHAGDLARARQDESKRLLARLRPGDQLVALDERGRGLSSEEFSSLIAEFADRGCRRLAFFVGGAHGHDEELRKRARAVLSLSPMVMNHQVARVVLLEQVYRALCIARGLPYHHRG